MAAKDALQKFSVVKDGDEYTIHVEGAGQTLSLSATRDQLDLIADDLDDLLVETEDEDEA